MLSHGNQFIEIVCSFKMLNEVSFIDILLVEEQSTFSAARERETADRPCSYVTRITETVNKWKAGKGTDWATGKVEMIFL